MIMNIPLYLWQTYKSKQLPLQAIPLIRSWRIKNPDLNINFMDDAMCDAFIEANFDSDFYNMYKSLPFGVMKSDVWRVAVVYINGGVYADTDCECMVPVTEWLKPEDKLIVAVEQPNGALANFAFAAEPRHPALKHILDLFLELYKSPNFLNKNSPTPIQDFGQYGFSHGILSYYNISGSMSEGGTTNFYNEKVENTGVKFILHQDHKFTNGTHKDNYITHHVASLSWRTGYASWRKYQKMVLGK